MLELIKEWASTGSSMQECLTRLFFIWSPIIRDDGQFWNLKSSDMSNYGSFQLALQYRGLGQMQNRYFIED